MANETWWNKLIRQVKSGVKGEASGEGSAGKPRERHRWSEDIPMDRRRFFRAGLAELMKPLSAAVKPLEHVANQIGRLEDPIPPKWKQTPPAAYQEPTTYQQAARNAAHEVQQADSGGASAPIVPLWGNESIEGHWVRPPGALPEQAFRDTCSRCGECVRVCPVQCIKIDSTRREGRGAPIIDVESMPCVLCDGLLCMHHCPTGALQPIPITEIRIGLAEWKESTCLRSHDQDCSICVDHCPVGPRALEIIDNRIEVHSVGCTGCGVCHHDCPTAPKSIVVIPISKVNQN